jgi:hypothetical protein
VYQVLGIAVCQKANGVGWPFAGAKLTFSGLPSTAGIWECLAVLYNRSHIIKL